MKTMIFVLTFALAASVGADIPWQFTIEDHPAPVKASAAGVSSTAISGFARVAIPSDAGDLSAFRLLRIASPGTNLRSDPPGMLIIIR